MIDWIDQTKFMMPFLKRLKQNVFCLLLLAIAVSTTGCGLIGLGVNTAIALLPLKLAFRCLPEGTNIDTPDGPRAVESLRAGDLVVGFKGEPVQVLQIQQYVEDASKEGFMTVEFENGAQVDLCDKHRIHGIRAEKLQVGDQIKSGHVVKAITVYGGVERSYDLLTEDKGYQIGGIPVNSMIEEMYEAGQTGKIKE